MWLIFLLAKSNDQLAYLLKVNSIFRSQIPDQKIEQSQLAYLCWQDCVPKKFFEISSPFFNSNFGYLANSVDPDQPAPSEAGWSGSTLFFKQLFYVAEWKLVDVGVTCYTC